MENFSNVQIILLLVLAVLIPGIIVHFTLGRKGGHHLFEKDLTKGEIRDLPFSMLTFRTRNNLIGSLVVLLGTATVIYISKIVCNAFGVTSEKDFWIIAGLFSVTYLVFLRFFMMKRK
jgi:hypothetical protein